jgi:hypothetical protein
MRNIVTILVVAIVIILIARTSTYRKNDPIVITKYDTVYQQKTFTKFTKGDSIPFIVLAVDSLKYTIHDTIKIVNDYLATKVFTDTFTIDSSKFTIIDTISHNTIQNRQFMAYIHEKTIFVTNNILPKSKNELYLGFLADLRAFDNKLGIGIGLGFKTSKNALFSISASTNGYSIGYFKKF